MDIKKNNVVNIKSLKKLKKHPHIKKNFILTLKNIKFIPPFSPDNSCAFTDDLSDTNHFGVISFAEC